MSCLSCVASARLSLFTVALLALLVPGLRSNAIESTQSLAGRWEYALDREDAGVREAWFERHFSEHLALPGSLPAQGIGDEIRIDTPWMGGIVDRSFFTAPEYARYREPGHIKVPFWLQPTRYYAGVSWFQRDVVIPSSWNGSRIALFLERPHWETRVWIDGQLVGTNQSLSTPHEYELGRIAPGSHRLSVRVDNRLVVDVGRDSHSISDHTQGNWNGIVGHIELRATPPVWWDDLQVYPHLRPGSVTVRGGLGNLTGQPGKGTALVRIFALNANAVAARQPVASVRFPVSWSANGGELEGELSVDQPALWDEFHPALYRAELTLEDGAENHATRSATFGFREFKAPGTQFTINGRLTFIRGTLECCIFPKTGHPPTDVDSWRRVIRIAKAHGLNNLRFHSWCPPEAAFQAADELGMYLHVECGSWANASTTLGDGKPVDGWIYQEADRILASYGNHPSFVMMLYGNEPGGPHHAEFLARWVAHYKALDQRRLYSSAAGWPQLPENDFHITPDPRVQAWGAGLKSRINALPPETMTDYRDYTQKRQVPVVSHEIGQWCVYPNFDEMKEYTGYLKPRNFEIFRDRLEEHGMLDLARPFLLASGKLQTLCYKEDIESALRTPGMGGFQLLDLHDFPGQGTALVGVLDPFWNDKGYVTAAEFHRFCGPTVPLARLPKRVFTQSEAVAIRLDVAHFGVESLHEIWPVFKFVDDQGRTFLKDHAPAREIRMGNGQALTEIHPDFSALPAPAHYKLVVGLARTAEGKDPVCENDWDLWVYPAEAAAPLPKDVVLVHALDSAALARLEAGGKVLWCIPPAAIAPDPKLGKVGLGFSSIFWNTAWTHRQEPQTLGILCDPKHPLFAHFPTENHSNWQWWYLVHEAGAMILDGLPQELRPTVQVVDDWFTARKLGLVLEAKVGAGKILVCSINLEDGSASGPDANPVRRQFRESLFRYLGSDQFRPKVSVGPGQLVTLVRTPSAR